MFKGSQDRSIAQSGAPVIWIDYAQQTEARSKRARGITPVEQSAFKPILADQMGAAEPEPHYHPDSKGQHQQQEKVGDLGHRRI